jgi:peptidoglycan/xylan/chitin deacetylase (PgdA/CDA1 family)
MIDDMLIKEKKERKQYTYRAKAGLTFVILIFFAAVVGLAIYFFSEDYEAYQAWREENPYVQIEQPDPFSNLIAALAPAPVVPPENPEPTAYYNEPAIPVYRIPTRVRGVYRPKIISLTFDDGPVPLTEYLLDILYEHGAVVTFCVIGDLVEEGAETVVRAFENGHEIIGHSWDHGAFTRLSVEAISEQIYKTSAIIEYVTGYAPPPIFRVPFGHFNGRIQTAAYEMGYGVLNWAIDPEDWRYRCEEHIYQFIMEYARDGAVVLLHDIHPTTIYAMEKVIPALINRGFTFVTASELIYHVYGHFTPGYEYTGVRR